MVKPGGIVDVGSSWFVIHGYRNTYLGILACRDVVFSDFRIFIHRSAITAVCSWGVRYFELCGVMYDVLLASVASNAIVFSTITVFVILLIRTVLGPHVDIVPVPVWPELRLELVVLRSYIVPILGPQCRLLMRCALRPITVRIR